MPETSGRFIGKYRGVVTKNDDPQKLMRVRARVPDLFGDKESGWALPCLPMAARDAGLLAVPPVGAWVWVEFERGDPDYPVWTGCFFTKDSDLPKESQNEPSKFVVLKTAGGHLLLLDDGSGKLTLQSKKGQKLVFSDDGIELNNGKGATIKLSGNKVAINDDALEVI